MFYVYKVQVRSKRDNMPVIFETPLITSIEDATKIVAEVKLIHQIKTEEEVDALVTQALAMYENPEEIDVEELRINLCDRQVNIINMPVVESYDEWDQDFNGVTVIKRKK